VTERRPRTNQRKRKGIPGEELGHGGCSLDEKIIQVPGGACGVDEQQGDGPEHGEEGLSILELAEIEKFAQSHFEKSAQRPR
jgi:hypothetical protein